MSSGKREKLFLPLCAVIFAAALVYVFIGARAEGPLVDYHEFSIPVTYEEKGEIKTKDVILCGTYYEDDRRWAAYYADSGMHESVPMESFDNGEWYFVLELEGGYLMGDPRYADFYAGGLPEPTITYYDDAWNEYTGVTEAEPFGIRLIGCEYPEPIENEFVDRGIRLDHKAAAVLTGFSVLILLLGVLLVKKDEDVVYGRRDKEARIANWLLGVLGVPFLLALGPGWEVVSFPWLAALSSVMAPICVLGICTSVLLRRKGLSRLGMAVQFVGPVLFVIVAGTSILPGFGIYGLFIPAGAAVGVLLAVLTKAGEDVVPTGLDRVSVICNLVLIPVYFWLSMPFILLAAIADVRSGSGAMLVFLAEVIAVITALAPVGCGAALGLSVALRKKGRSLVGFLIQFAGFGVLAVILGLLLLCEQLPWLVISIN